jgi:Fe-S-cluster containining protein
MVVDSGDIETMNFKLAEIYKQIPASTCPPGCGKCCGILFPSMAEIRNIKDWLTAHHREYKEFHMAFGLDCPYLNEKKECTIYPVRPFLCRMMCVSDLSCPVGKCKANKILNSAQSRMLYRQIYLKGKEKPRTEKHQLILASLLNKIKV